MHSQFADLKVRNLVQIKKFEPVINPEWIVDHEIGAKAHLIDNYIVTEEIAQVIESMLESFTESRATKSKNKAELNMQTLKQAHLITGTYGTGKSYLLLMMLGLFKAFRDPALFLELSQKFSDFPYLMEHISRLRNRKYLTVCINAQGLGGDVSFKDLIIRGLIAQFQKETKETLTLNSEFDTALKVIERMKEMFAQNMPKGETVQSLKNALMARKRPALQVFREIFMNITNAQPETYGTDVDSILADAVKQVKSKGYDGVLFIVDEFSQYLSASMAAGLWAQDLAQLQLFADKVCNDLRNRVYFIASVHEDLTKIGSMSDSDRSKLEVVLDRFRNHPLSLVNYAKLISGIFNVDKAKLSVIATKTNPSHDVLQALAKSTGANYQDYFPLHPSVIPHLPVISRKLASSQRTTFLFLAEYVSGQRLNEPLVNSSGDLNLVTIVDMMDWFWGDLGKKGYENVLQAANIMLQYYPEGSLARKVIKLLVALYIAVAGSENLDVAQYSVTSHEVSEMLSARIQDVQTVLAALESRQEGVIQKNADGRFYFSTQIVPPVRPLVAKYVNEVNVDNVLLEQIKASQHIKPKYQINVDPWNNIRVPRTVVSRQVTLNYFLNGQVDLSIPDDYDGLYIFIAPSLSQHFNQQDRDLALSRAKVLVDKYRNIVVGLPQSMIQLIPNDFRWFGALQLAKQKTSSKDDQMAIVALDRELQNTYRKISVQLSNWLQPSNITFISAVGVSTTEKLDSVIKSMLKLWYCKFPSFERESLSSGAVKDMGTRILQAPGKITTPLESNAQIEGRNGHLLKTLVPLGLAKFREESGQFVGHLTEPTKGPSLEIWQILQFGLTAEQSEHKWGIDSPLSKVVRGELDASELLNTEIVNLGGIYKSIEGTYKILKSQPYGLSDELIELYIVCLVGLGKARLKGGMHYNANLKDITLKKDKAYRFYRNNALSPEKRLYINNVFALLDEAIGNTVLNAYIPAVGQIDDERIAEDMKDRFRSLLNVLVKPCRDALRELHISNWENRLLEAVTSLINIPESNEFLSRVYRLGNDLTGSQINMDLDAGYTSLRCAINFYKQAKPYDTALIASVKRFNVISKAQKVDPRFDQLYEKCVKTLEQLKSEGSVELIRNWLTSFQELWEVYTERYNQEHEVLASTYKELSLSILSSPSFEILNVLSNFGLSDVAGPSHVKVYLNQFIPCHIEQPLTKEYLTAVETSCASCKYALGKLPELVSKANEAKEVLAKMLTTAIRKSSEKILQFCDEANIIHTMNSTFPAYLAIKGYRQESSRLVSILNKLCENNELTDEDVSVISSTGKLFAQYLKDARGKKVVVVEKKPKVKVTELLDQVKAQLIASGSVEMPIDDVAETLQTFLRKKYSNFIVRISEGEGNG